MTDMRNTLKERRLYLLRPFEFKDGFSDPKDKFLIPLRTTDRGVVFVMPTSQRGVIPLDDERSFGQYVVMDTFPDGSAKPPKLNFFIKAGTSVTDGDMKIRRPWVMAKDTFLTVFNIKFYSWDRLNDMASYYGTQVRDCGAVRPELVNDIFGFVRAFKEDLGFSIPMAARAELERVFGETRGEVRGGGYISRIDKERLSGIGATGLKIRALERDGEAILNALFVRERRIYEDGTPPQAGGKIRATFDGETVRLSSMDGSLTMRLREAVSRTGALASLAAGAPGKKADTPAPSLEKSKGGGLKKN